MISSQTIYGLHDLNDDIVSIRRDVTIRDNEQPTKEDSATHPMETGRLSFAIYLIKVHSRCSEKCAIRKSNMALKVQKKCNFFRY